MKCRKKPVAAEAYDSMFITAEQWVASRKCECGGEVMRFMFSCSDCFVPDPPREVTVVPFPTEEEWKADLIRRGQ